MNSEQGIQGAPEPDSPLLAAEQAAAWLDRDRIMQARHVLMDALAKHPRHPELLYQAARTEMMDGREKDALDHLTTLLASQPGHEGGRFLLFHLEMASGHLPAAETLILGLLRECPQEALYYASYARLMLRSLEFRKASQLADEAIRLAPHFPPALNVKALCEMVEGRSGLDNTSLVRLLTQQPDDARTLRLVVVALVDRNRSREALRLARELLKAQPNDPDLLELVLALRHSTHWSLWPLWPMQRWGWAGSAGLWGGMLLISMVLGRLAPQYRGAFGLAWLGFVVYSWAWPPLLKRLINRGAR